MERRMNTGSNSRNVSKSQPFLRYGILVGNAIVGYRKRLLNCLKKLPKHVHQVILITRRYTATAVRRYRSRYLKDIAANKRRNNLCNAQVNKTPEEDGFRTELFKYCLYNSSSTNIFSGMTKGNNTRRLEQSNSAFNSLER